MPEVKTWREDDVSQPKFPDNFKVEKKAVLQVTDLVTNRNKYYAIEVHSAGNKYRVYTHYGRTDDLETNSKAGCRESRYCDSAHEAESIYGQIYKQKTSARKGYKELSLASAKIGSTKSHGQSSGVVDEKTIQKMAKPATKVSAPRVLLAPAISNIVDYLYSEAVNALTTTVNVSITANGIETPLGVLTLGQIDKGELVLSSISSLLGSKNKTKATEITKLTGDFYTVIPHRIGRSRDGLAAHLIDNANKIKEKQDTLQLMRDMLNVNGDTNVLLNPEIDKKYKALNCEIIPLDAAKVKEIGAYVNKSRTTGSGSVKIKNVWGIKRSNEHASFNEKIGNNKMLFHGSAPRNWVGILSRGLLLPKAVVKLGVHRTDAGWLGNGIYFGSESCTSLNYAGTGKRDTSFLTVAEVALGKIKVYKKITYGLDSPPTGFNSCHGDPKGNSEFADNEYVIYEQNQQRLQYLVECE